MTYDLAKKLKEAGFPQLGYIYSRWICFDDCEHEQQIDASMQGINTVRTFNKKENAYLPTLSELIDACGERFEYLNKVHGGGWIAGTCDVPIGDTLGESNYESGNTKEEAVANLWLFLNKKG